MQPGLSFDADRLHDMDTSIPDVRVTRPLGPYEFVRVEALNGATLTNILSVYGANVDYQLLRKSSFALDRLDLPSRVGEDFSSEFYEGNYVVGLLTSDGRIVRLIFSDLAFSEGDGKRVTIGLQVFEGI